MFNTPKPSAERMVEDAKLKSRLAELAQRQQEATEGLKGQPLTDLQVEAERFQAEANTLAETSPFYAAARSASVHFLVVPLEPGGTAPLVDPAEATNDPRILFNWWSTTEAANIGVRLGRIGGILALRVEDDDAYLRLRELATVKHYDPDTDSGFLEYREIGGSSLRNVPISKPVSMRSVSGWGKDVTRALIKRDREERQREPEGYTLVWAFPSVISGNDAFSYRSRKVGQGLTLLVDGVLPWDGSVLDNVRVVGGMARPPEIPLWLAAMLGRPRSRREMAAAREVYESLQRLDTAHVIGAIAAQQAAIDEARNQAEDDRQKAERILHEAMNSS